MHDTFLLEQARACKRVGYAHSLECSLVKRQASSELLCHKKQACANAFLSAVVHKFGDVSLAFRLHEAAYYGTIFCQASV